LLSLKLCRINLFEERQCPVFSAPEHNAVVGEVQSAPATLVLDEAACTSPGPVTVLVLAEDGCIGFVLVLAEIACTSLTWVLC